MGALSRSQKYSRFLGSYLTRLPLRLTLKITNFKKLAIMGDVGDAPKKLSMVHNDIKTANFPTIPSTSSQTLI